MQKKINISLVIILLIASFLRLYKLGSVPVSLFGDELDVGYHAFSLLKTGRDYTGNFLPIHLHSLAEYRTPLFIYSTIPTVAIFGISPLGVRLPAAIFGILSVWAFYLLVKQIRTQFLGFGAWNLEILASFLLAISPWHIEYSRAAFEVTELLFFLLIGLYLFFKALDRKGSLLWLSAACFTLLPWIYSTAKMFTPILLGFLIIFWFKDLLKLPKKALVMAIAVAIILGVPITCSTVLGGGAGRFGYIGIFTDPTLEPEIGAKRLQDAASRGALVEGTTPRFTDRMFHNKIVYWADVVTRNYSQTFSTDFLFEKGDPNLRHSIKGIGQFYKIEAIPLFVGIVFFFSKKGIAKKAKLLMLLWLIGGAFPAELTRDGGNHATRLILILPPLVFLIAYGIHSFPRKIHKNLPPHIMHFAYYILLFAAFVFYQHNFWVHNPMDSERWWHYGWHEAVTEVKQNQASYDKVVISSADEPPWLFFAANYELDPSLWQNEFPIGNDVDLEGFGRLSHIGKFYFGTPQGRGLYEWGQVIDAKTLYLASAKEVNVNLITEPERTPKDLVLIKSIAFPSGEPAFYIFTGQPANEKN